MDSRRSELMQSFKDFREACSIVSCLQGSHHKGALHVQAQGQEPRKAKGRTHSLVLNIYKRPRVKYPDFAG